MKLTMLRVILSALLLSTTAGTGWSGAKGRAADGSQAATPQAAVSGGCLDVTKINYKSDDTLDKSTFSTSFVDVPNSGVVFNQGGTGSSCAIVTFTAETFTESNGLMQIRARLDDSVTAAPGVVQLSGDDDEDLDNRWARSHAFTFIFPSVAPGSHRVRIQFRSVDFFREVVIHKHTVVVQHR